MRKESEVAAKWWANILKNSDIHDNGDLMGSALANWGRGRLKPLSDGVIENFENNLAKRIEQEIEKSKAVGNWQENNPNFCSGLRAGWLDIDYHVCGILKEVAIASGISEKGLDLRFPIKTIMRINPNEVKVRHGYGADAVKLL